MDLECETCGHLWSTHAVAEDGLRYCHAFPTCGCDEDVPAEKITVTKPPITYDTVLKESVDGIHPPYQKVYQRVIRYTPSPVNCSMRGHTVRFRTGYQDGCDTCGVEW